MADDEKKELAVEEENQTKYTPLYDKLEEVAVPTGEEEEDLLWTDRCILYRFAADVSGQKMWCNRGKGDVKILRHKTKDTARLVLREDKTMKLRLNSIIVADTEVAPHCGSDRAFTWSCLDHSEGNEEGKVESFAIKFKTPEIAATFQKNYNLAREGKFEELLAALSLAEDNKGKEHEADVATWAKVMKETKTARMEESALRELWDQFDKDKSGFIELKELEALFMSLVDAFVVQLGGESAPEALKDMRAAVPNVAKANMAKLDKNKDNKVSWEEFLALEDVAMSLPTP